MSIKKLVSDIKRESKIPMDELITYLATAIEEDECCDDIYKELYHKAWGNHLNEAICKNWVNSVGEHWTVEQTTDVGQKESVDWNKISKWEFWAIMNAWFPDFKRTAKNYELEDDPEFFADIVLDYFCYDTDAKNKSIAGYYFDHVM